MTEAALLLAVMVAATPVDRLHVVSSPEIVGGVVTLRLRAPRAREVLVDGLPGHPRAAMARDGEGIWTARIGPLAPGIYAYGFVVDGLRLPDAQNPWVRPSRFVHSSVFEVPGHEDYQDRGAPHGAVVLIEYRWRGRPRRMHVYTPPGAERGPALPAVYLLHGYSDTDETWTAFGRAHVILDNLIADRRAPPVVVVMSDGQPLAPHDGQDRLAFLAANAEEFAAELRDEIVPLVERRFRVVRDRGGRAVIGFSMGAHQALLSAPLFHAVVAIGPELTPERIAARDGDTLMVMVPPGRGILPALERAVAELGARGVAASLSVTPDGDLWPSWRRRLAELLPRLALRPGSSAPASRTRR